jgi:hypothetical protein
MMAQRAIEYRESHSKMKSEVLRETQSSHIKIRSGLRDKITQVTRLGYYGVARVARKTYSILVISTSYSNTTTYLLQNDEREIQRVWRETIQQGGRKKHAKKGYKPSQWNGRCAFKKPIIQQPKCEGKCAELKSFIYDCSDSRQSDIFTKTTKEIAEYVDSTYKYGQSVQLAQPKGSLCT